MVPGSGEGSTSASGASEASGVGVDSEKPMVVAGLGVGVGVGVGVEVALGLGVGSVKPMVWNSCPKIDRPFQQTRAAAKKTHAKERRLSTCVISDKGEAKGRKIAEPDFTAADSYRQPVCAIRA